MMSCFFLLSPWRVMSDAGTKLVAKTSPGPKKKTEPDKNDDAVVGPSGEKASSNSSQGPGRLATLLLARKDQLMRIRAGRRRRGSSCSSCGRNTLSLSDSESLAGSSKRSHDNLSRNSSSGQSGATVQTLLSSPYKGKTSFQITLVFPE